MQEIRPQNGINLKKVAHGIESIIGTTAMLNRMQKTIKRYANNAASLFLDIINPNFVTITVKANGDACRELTTNHENVQSAERDLSATDTHEKSPAQKSAPLKLV